MKNTLIVMTFAVLIILIFTRLAMAEGKTTIAVLDFESVGSEEHLGKAIAEIMRTELIGVGRSGLWNDLRSTRLSPNSICSRPAR